jgi:hypothetical protein
MANYYATARTSYTKVKDDVGFLRWAETISEAEVITHETEEHGTLYGFLFGPNSDCGSIPHCKYDEELGEDFDLDIFSEIQPHIADGWSITFMEVGAEKYRYVVGTAAVVTPKEIEHYDLNRWVSETLNGLGDPMSTSCEY